MDARNTKNRYHNQLRNFSKVYSSKYSIQILNRKFKTNSIKSIHRPMAKAASQNWKLASKEKDNEEAEEVILRVQGIICNQDLPPIERPFEM